MATVNVNRGLTDQFYRYKMPRLLAKVEGKGNGIKTVIVNMVEVAKALNRPPMYPTKYFGCVLGAQVNCDVKNERYIVNGSHDSNKLQDLLDGFIRKYVLCQNCENPETMLLVNQKKGTINASCKACGHLAAIGVKDKLSTYILKCPPDQSMAPGASTVTKKTKKAAKKEANGRGSPQNEDDEDGTGFDKNGAAADNGDEENDDDDDWCDNQRIEELTSGAQKLTVNADLEKPTEERLEIFYEFLKRKLEDKTEVNVATQKEIVAEAERLDVKDKAVIVVCELLFKDPTHIIKVIESNRNLFLRFTKESPKAQKYLLRGIELTIAMFPKELLKGVVRILKLFFDLDILDEKIILDWGSKKKGIKDPVVKEIHEKAQVFITWLKEAESESDDDGDGDEVSDEEETLEVVYDERSRPDKIVELKEEPKISPLKKTKGEDDIDIDAI